MADTILTLDCWHNDCDYAELLQGTDIGETTIYTSNNRAWAAHNAMCHPDKPRTGRP